jgi:hypothetical protein
MNVQSIFEALDEDDQNSALGIICAELENQGYTVNISGRLVDSSSFFDGELPEIEGQIGPLNFVLLKAGAPEQEFAIEFTEFHEIIIKKTMR